MPALSVEAADGDELLAAAMGQLDDGADLVKLYLDGPDPSVARGRSTSSGAWWTRSTRAARGSRRTAGTSPGRGRAPRPASTRSSTGSSSTTDVAATMARNGVRLVSTLAVMASWQTFATTTALPRFARAEGRARVGGAARAGDGVASASPTAAGVSIATGTDFGGGSTRANQLAWEVEQLVEAGPRAVGGARLRDVARRRAPGEPDAGVIREGGPADFVLVHGDPCPDPTALWRVWHVAWAS